LEEALEILLRHRPDLQGKTLAEAQAILRAESQVPKDDVTKTSR
jgi:hypothetical protein